MVDAAGLSVSVCGYSPILLNTASAQKQQETSWSIRSWSTSGDVPGCVGTHPPRPTGHGEIDRCYRHFTAFDVIDVSKNEGVVLHPQSMQQRQGQWCAAQMALLSPFCSLHNLFGKCLQSNNRQRHTTSTDYCCCTETTLIQMLCFFFVFKKCKVSMRFEGWVHRPPTQTNVCRSNQ